MKNLSMLDNKRYVVEQTWFECESIKLLRMAATNCIDAWIEEVKDYDARFRNEGYDFPDVDNPFTQCMKRSIMGKYSDEYRGGLSLARKDVETESFSSVHDIIKFFKRIKPDITYEYLLGAYIQRAAISICHEINTFDDEADICDILELQFIEPAKHNFLEKYQNTVIFKDDRVSVMMFSLVEQWIPPEGNKWEFNTTVVDANWYIQGLGLRKGVMRSCDIDYELWYRDIYYGQEEISGGIGLLHGDD